MYPFSGTMDYMDATFRLRADATARQDRRRGSEGTAITTHQYSCQTLNACSHNRPTGRLPALGEGRD